MSSEDKSSAAQALLVDVDKVELISDLSHELRTVLGGVIGINELLLTDELTSHQRQLSETIEQSSKTLLVVLNDLVDLCRVEITKQKVESAPIDVNKLITDLKAQIEYMTIARKTPIFDEVKLPILVMTDGGRLRQILIIFVTRLVRCVENSPIKLSIYETKTDADRLLMRIEVATEGIGAHDQLFLSTLNEPVKEGRKLDSRWLSLYLAYRLVGLLSGTCGTNITNKCCTLWAEIPASVPPGLRN